MKRIICIVMSMLIFFSFGLTAGLTAFAQESDASTVTQSSKIMFEDGSYCIITITETSTRATKSGTKTRSYYNNNDELDWKVQAHGTFTYNGTTSTCTSASHTVTIYDDAWYTYSQNSYESGNKAIADVTMKKKLLGIVTSTRDVHLELVCDKDGNLS